MAAADIFERLTQDHDRHRKLFAAIERTTGESEERRSLFETLKLETTAHAAAEEETFYVTTLGISDLREDGRDGVSEHKEIAIAFLELTDLKPSDPGWKTKFESLKKTYFDHIDEEEKDKFPAARKAIPAERAKQLLDEFNRRKPEETERAEAHADEPTLRDEMSGKS